MNNPYLMRGKFNIATLPERYLSRHSLINKFQREASSRVIYISAPSGYGKTISTRLWLEASGRIPLWITLDEYDNTPSIFYKLFCTGISSLQPENKAMADILANPLFAVSPIEYTILLLSEFMPDGQQYAIVLDDMHLVHNNEIRKSGLLVEKRLPSSFTVIILTQNEVAEDYIYITGKERCTIFTSRDLMFSVEEIQKYFLEYGHFITLEEAKSIHESTNGWPMGVTAIAMSNEINYERNIGQLLHNRIKAYIWDKWDEDIKGFMLKSSLLYEMTAELCDVITGRNDSGDILEKLCRNNAFIYRLPNGSYKYHNLFLGFLRDQSQHSNIDTTTLYLKAAKYYFEQDSYFTAKQYAVKSGDVKMLAAQLNNFLKNRGAFLRDFIHFSRLYGNETPPESICDKIPFLYTIQMWENYLLGNAKKMEYFMDKTYEFLPKIASDFPEHFETAILMIALDHRIPISQLIDKIALFPPLTAKHAARQNVAFTHGLPFLHRGNRDYSELVDSALMEKARKCFGELINCDMDAFFLGIESGLLLEKNLLEESMNVILNAMLKEGAQTNEELHFSISMHMAEICYVMGGPSSKKLIKEIEDFIQLNNAHYLTPNFMAYKTMVQLSNGDNAAASSWLENYCVTDTEHWELYKILQHFVTARAYIVLSKVDNALKHIQKLRELATDFNRPIDIAEANVLQAILEWAIGNKTKALETLQDALLAMQPLGFIRIFANEGVSILPMLKRLALKTQSVNYSGELDSCFLNKTIISAYEQSKKYKGITVNIRSTKPIKLSKQQCYILSLLAKGYKQAQITQLTNLSIHTVKSHVAAAYAKLGVNSAVDAVVKARELKLID